LIRGLLGKTLDPRQATQADFLDGQGAAIDSGIALYFPAPRSYTGEDVLELHGHGGPVVQRELLQRCHELGARLARPGEFTERAYLSGKLDLAQAESVADLIDAATTQAARSALRSLQGAFSHKVVELTRAVIELRTLVEATLDFPDEEIEFLRQADAEKKLAAVLEKAGTVLSESRRGSLLREGVHVVLAGQPNVGKSSLLNRLAGEELAIVTEYPGTTRDAIRQSLSLDGVPVHVIDTAGLRDTRDPVEQIGIDRTWEAISRADMVVLMLDAVKGLQAEDSAITERLPKGLPCIRVMNKCDLLGEREPAADPEALWISAKTGMGVEQLKAAILGKAGWHVAEEGLYLARERHVQALQKAVQHLVDALAHCARLELLAEELRLTQEALGSITGEYTTEDLLGEIFSRFCIGK
jgi:tRNA modification GTPase